MTQKQHTDIQRKIKLRQQLIEKLGKFTGAIYVPFIGEGDIAVALYSDNKIYGADIDPAMVETAKARLPDAEIITADCDKYPFKKSVATFNLADFDAYSYPYDSFRSFFETAKIGSQCALIFTDGQRQAIIHTGHYRMPDGKKQHAKTVTEKRDVFNFYFNKTILPWFKDYIKPWRILYITKYLRGTNQIYWGAIISKNGNGKTLHNGKTGEVDSNKCNDIKKDAYLEYIRNGHTRGYAATLTGLSRVTIFRHMKKDAEFAEAVSEAETDAIAKVENALYEAATSGNVTAIQVFLYNRDPKRWSDRRNIQIAGEGGGPIKVEHDLSDEQLTEIINRSRGRGATKEEAST
uniref:Putative methyltransferase n=1 Tax=viral metagenome TaxID=1070528 RepID=A0A6M3KV19_9ZZZZ